MCRNGDVRNGECVCVVAAEGQGPASSVEGRVAIPADIVDELPAERTGCSSPTQMVSDIARILSEEITTQEQEEGTQGQGQTQEEGEEEGRTGQAGHAKQAIL